MDNSDPILNIVLDGPEIPEGRIPVDALVVVLNKIQLCVKRLGQVLSGEESKATHGKIKAAIEDSCRLEVRAFSPSSFDVALDLFDKTSPEVGNYLGERAVGTLVSGVARLAQDKSEVVEEFGPGVLAALKDVSQVLDRGIDTISLRYRGNGSGPVKSVIDRRVRDRILISIAGPIESPHNLRGALKEVDLENNTCRIYISKRKFFSCVFDDNLKPNMRDDLDRFIFAEGTAVRDKSTGRVIEFRIREIRATSGRSDGDLMAGGGSLPKSGAELLQSLRDSGFVGMWADRGDAEDSLEFARRLRGGRTGQAQED